MTTTLAKPFAAPPTTSHAWHTLQIDNALVLQGVDGASGPSSLDHGSVRRLKLSNLGPELSGFEGAASHLLVDEEVDSAAEAISSSLAGGQWGWHRRRARWPVADYWGRGCRHLRGNRSDWVRSEIGIATIRTSP
jgi:hypothetical protein